MKHGGSERFLIFYVIPANAGIQTTEQFDAKADSEVLPIRVRLPDQIELPGSAPLLDLLIAQDRALHGCTLLEPDQPLDPFLRGEATESLRDAGRRSCIRFDVTPR